MPSRQKTDEAMFVATEQPLMFILGDGREPSAPRSVAESAACVGLLVIREHCPVMVRAVAGLLREARP